MKSVLSTLQLIGETEQVESKRVSTTDGATEWTEIDEGYLAENEDVEVTDELGTLEDANIASFLCSFLDAAEPSVFVIDAAGVIRYNNQPCRNLFDREVGEILGSNLFEYENADNDIVKEQVIEEGKPIQNKQEEIELDDGSTRYSERSVYPIFGRESDVVGAIEINRDVTERVLSKRREEALMAYQADAISELKQYLTRLGDGDFTVTPEIPTPDREFDELDDAYDEFEEMGRVAEPFRLHLQ